MNEELRSLLEEWTRAIAQADVAAAGRVLADDYVLTSAGGVAPHVSRQAWLEALTEIETTSFTCAPVEARVFGDVAVVASRASWNARLGERDLSGDYAVTDVFTRRDGSWRASWRISTRLPEGTP